jgi:hypothetical protein
MKRYDAIRFCSMGGWSFSPDDIKECSDGELVKYDDAQAIIDGLQNRLDELNRKYEWLDSNSVLKDFPEY